MRCGHAADVPGADRWRCVVIAVLVLLPLMFAAEWWTRPPKRGRRNAPQIYRHPQVFAAYLTRLNREDAP